MLPSGLGDANLRIPGFDGVPEMEAQYKAVAATLMETVPEVFKRHLVENSPALQAELEERERTKKRLRLEAIQAEQEVSHRLYLFISPTNSFFI